MKSNNKIAIILGHHPLAPVTDVRVWREFLELRKYYQIKIFCLVPSGQRSIKNSSIIAAKLPVKLKTRGTSVFSLIAKILQSIPVIWRQINAIRAYKPAVIHCHDADTLIIGVLAKVFTSSKLIYDSHEAATEMASWRKIKPLIGCIETISMPFIDGLVTPSRAITSLLKKKYQHLKNIPTLYLYNYPNISSKKLEKPNNHEIVFIYQGSFKAGRGLENVIAAFAKSSSGKLILCGGSKKEISILKNNISQSARGKIIFTGNIDQASLWRYLVRADIGIVPSINDCLNSYYGTPNKLFEYLMAGCAVISPDFPTFQDVVCKNKLGWTCDFTSVSSIGRALSLASRHRHKIQLISKKSRRLAETQYNWEKQAPRFINFYKRILHAKTR